MRDATLMQRASEHVEAHNGDRGLQAAMTVSHPMDPELWIEQAHASRVRGEVDDAILYASKAQRLAPTDCRTLRELAMAYAAKDDHLDDAVRVMQHATELDEDDALNWAVLGTVRMATGQGFDAAMAAERALSIDPECVEAHLVLGDAALAFGGWSKARARFEYVLDLAPDSSRAREALRLIEEQMSSSGAHAAHAAFGNDAADADEFQAEDGRKPHIDTTQGADPTDDASEWFPALTGGPADVLTMNREVVDAVERHIDACNRCDVEAVIDGFADDAVFRAAGEVFVGTEALYELFSETFAGPDRTVLNLRSSVVQNGTAACELTEQIETESGRYDSDFFGLYTVHSGKIVRVRLYRDE